MEEELPNVPAFIPDAQMTNGEGQLPARPSKPSAHPTAMVDDETRGVPAIWPNTKAEESRNILAFGQNAKAMFWRLAWTRK